MERGQALGSRDYVESVIGEGFFELCAEGLRAVDQKIAESLLIGEGVDEVSLGDDELALENTVVQRGDQAHFGAADVEHVADFSMEHVGDRVRVRNSRDRAVDWVRIKQGPRVRSFRDRFGKTEARQDDKLAAGAQRTGGARPAQIEAARIFAAAPPAG